MTTHNANQNLCMHKTPDTDPEYQAILADVVEAAKDMKGSGITCIKATLKFARKFCHQLEVSEDRDGKIGGIRREQLLAAIGQFCKVSELQIQSRFKTIGEQADFLEKHAASIPSSRDALYEIAVAAKNGEKVAQWISDGKITPESTLRDLKALRGNQVKPTKKPPKQLPFPVIIYFKSSADAARILTPIISTDGEFKLAFDKALENAFKEKPSYQSYRKKVAA